MNKLIWILAATIALPFSAEGMTDENKTQGDTINILGNCLPIDVIKPVKSGDRPLTNAIDTIDTEYPGVRIILYNNNTWKFLSAADSTAKTDVFHNYWEEQVLNPYKLPLDSLPETWSVWLVDELATYHSPVDCDIRITSNFGMRRGRRHQGIDIGLPTGTPLFSTFDGVVRVATRCGGYGDIIVIRHDNGLETFYAHMSRFDVKPGDKVKAGDQIGLSGNTGRSTGPHLHYEIRYDGYALDPKRVIDFNYGYLRQRIMVLKRRYFDSSSCVTQDFDDEFRNQEDDAIELAALKKKAEEEARKREAAAMKWHTVKSGECLSTIARKYHTSVDAIVRLNKKTITNKSNIRIGAKIRVR